MKRKFFMETYGCQMNTAESGALKSRLTASGWEFSDNQDEADLVIINTCSVRKTAENRIWGRLGYYKRKKSERDFKLAVMGCMTERLGEEIRKEFPVVDFLIGTFGKDDFFDQINCSTYETGNFFGSSKYHFAEMHSSEGEFQAMVPIMHGCDNYCSYCIVPYVRGHEVSRSPEDVISEVKTLERKGVREITLIGQNVNSYSFSGENTDSCLNFAGLLDKILKETGIPWIRFMSSHPKDLSDELIDVIASDSRICRHIHLPVQHGSSKILEAMNRKYNRAYYLGLVEKMRRAIPGLSLTTDILIGFPGETEEDFLLTMDLAREVRFDDAFTYQYNAMEKTAAYSFPDQIEEETKKRRLAELIELQRSISSEIKEKYIGLETDVLVEKVSKKSGSELLGRMENNNTVVFSGDRGLIGSICRIKIKSLAGNTFLGDMICLGD